MDKVSKEYLKVVVEALQKDKSLVFNDWSIDFYIYFYEYIKEDLLKLVERTRIPIKILGSIESTFIYLIPKNDC